MNNGLRQLLNTVPVLSHIDTRHMAQEVLVEVIDDPFGPPVFLFVAVVSIDQRSLSITLYGYECDTDGCKTSNWKSIRTTATGFRVCNDKEDN